MSGRRIGVYVCHCGGNISDYVDVERVAEAARGEDDVVVAKTAMFTCSDATQQEMQQDIETLGLDGLVVASCSPKLHTFTFRGVARRAGLNPYRYTQVNVREQCSWAHTDDREGATEKAIRLVRAGIARTRLSTSLTPTVVDTQPSALVIGGGVAGLRAAVGLADLGLDVYLVERTEKLGGWTADLGPLFPGGRDGRAVIDDLLAEVAKRPRITVYTNAEVTRKAGSFGHFTVDVRVRRGDREETQAVEVGSIIVATGFQTYEPEAGEYGYGIPGVMTLPAFTAWLNGTEGALQRNGRPIETIAYIYCVGSRSPDGHGAAYCSKYCCSAAVHTGLRVLDRDPRVHQYHLYRDMRTYGRYELLYDQSRRRGVVYLKFPDDTPPTVAQGPDGSLLVTVQDQLTEGRTITIQADLVVLVTGMVPRENRTLIEALKLPVGRDGFFNEIHPKLRPVETVVDGVLVAGSCQGPKTVSESVASSLAAVAQAASVLKPGRAELDPQVATVDPATCTGCGDCVDTCPYGAIRLEAVGDVRRARVDPATCKGCGGCVPSCPTGALDLLGASTAQLKAMIASLAREPVTP